MMDDMKPLSTRRRTSYGALFALTAASCAFAFYIVSGLQQSAQLYDHTLAELQRPIYGGELKRVVFPDVEKPVIISSFAAFHTDGSWILVSKDHPLRAGFQPSNLIDTTVPHGDSATPMKVDARLVEPLARLFADAEAAGHPLMLSSAYRSITDQQALYDDFAATRGQANADRYVADPGTSEHHTGLAIDFSDRSDACASDSNRCNLSFSTALWLSEHAHTYGFILRYPEGKQPLTGIAYEPWHYRYVGPVLAPAIYTSGLTLDEALAQMRPALTTAR